MAIITVINEITREKQVYELTGWGKKEGDFFLEKTLKAGTTERFEIELPVRLIEGLANQLKFIMERSESGPTGI